MPKVKSVWLWISQGNHLFIVCQTFLSTPCLKLERADHCLLDNKTRSHATSKLYSITWILKDCYAYTQDHISTEEQKVKIKYCYCTVYWLYPNRKHGVKDDCNAAPNAEVWNEDSIYRSVDM